MRDAVTAAMRTRPCSGLFLLAWGAFTFFFSFSLGLASGEEPTVTRPRLLRNADRTDVHPEVSGIVLDSQSNSISDVCVFAWNAGRPVYTETGKTGRFKLFNVLGQGGALYARADGFRFNGITIESDAKNVQIKLTRATEPATRLMNTLPDLPSLKKAYDSLSAQFGPFAKKCIASAEKTVSFRQA
jgi:hypothetical protein